MEPNQGQTDRGGVWDSKINQPNSQTTPISNNASKPQTAQNPQDISTLPQTSTDNKTTSVWAILSLIFAFPVPLLGLIFGIIALVKIQNNPKLKGKGLAIAGIILSLAIIPLILLSLIGALAYFGALNPTNLLPERCEFPSGLTCTEVPAAKISGGAGNQICFPITNTLGYDVNGVRAEVQGCVSGEELSLKNGDSANLCFDQCTGSFRQGDMYGYTVDILYTSVDTLISRTSTGKIAGKWNS